MEISFLQKKLEPDAWLDSIVSKAARRAGLILVDDHKEQNGNKTTKIFELAKEGKKTNFIKTEYVKIELLEKGDSWALKTFSQGLGDKDFDAKYSSDVDFDKNGRLISASNINVQGTDSSFLNSLKERINKQLEASKSSINFESAPSVWNNAKTSVKVGCTTVGLTFAMVFSYLLVEWSKQVSFFKDNKPGRSLKASPGDAALLNYKNNKELSDDDCQDLADAFNEAAKVAPPFDINKRELGKQVAFAMVARLALDPNDQATQKIAVKAGRKIDDLKRVGLLIIGRETKAAQPSASPTISPVANGNANSTKPTPSSTPKSSNSKEEKTKKVEEKKKAPEKVAPQKNKQNKKR